MEWFEISKLGAEISFVFCCAGFCIYQLTTYFKNSNLKEKRNEKKDDEQNDINNKRYDELLKLIQEQNIEGQKKYDELVNKVLNEVTNHHLSSEKNDSQLKIETEIDLSLQEFLSKTGASRVFLVRYHNGGNDMNGLPFLKMSITNEKDRSGIQSLQKEYVNQFRSCVAYWCGQIEENGFCFINNIEEIKNKDPMIFDDLKNRGVIAKYGISIKNNLGSIIGYVAVEFTNDNNINIEQIKHYLQSNKIKFEALLNL